LIHLILSLDYEIFGNGAGDVMRDIIEPTSRILNICDRYGAKLSIMFEAAEYWAFKQMENRFDVGYSPAKAMEEQAQEAIRRGHDVQLHLHPQWIGAKLNDCLWRLRIDQWRIADLPHGLGDREDEYSIMGVLSKGKQTLEQMLRPVNPTYRCIAFRAGGFCIQPSLWVILAMKAVGLLIDSSVVKGLYDRSLRLRSGQALGAHHDFRKAMSNYGYWWTTEDDVCLKGSKGEYILEFPVYSRMQPYITNFRWSKLWTTLKRRKIESRYSSAINQAGGIQSTTKLSEVLMRLASMHPVNVDFCKLSARAMVAAVEEILLKNGNSEEEIEHIVPVVLIGHSKDFWNDKHFDSFLSAMRSYSDGNRGIQFSTFFEAAEEIVSTSNK